jgi:hypothetical protein
MFERELRIRFYKTNRCILDFLEGLRFRQPCSPSLPSTIQDIWLPSEIDPSAPKRGSPRIDLLLNHFREPDAIADYRNDLWGRATRTAALNHAAINNAFFGFFVAHNV